MANKRLSKRKAKSADTSSTRRSTTSQATIRSEEKARREALKKAFAEIEKIRKRAKPLPKGVTVKDLIEEGRL